MSNYVSPDPLDTAASNRTFVYTAPHDPLCFFLGSQRKAPTRLVTLGTRKLRSLCFSAHKPMGNGFAPLVLCT